MTERGTYAFQVTALRRVEEATDQPNHAGAASFRIGHRLARLVAEAPAGCALQIRTSGAGPSLHIEVSVAAAGPTVGTRAGMPKADDVLSHLASEAHGMVAEAAVVTPVRRIHPRNDRQPDDMEAELSSHEVFRSPPSEREPDEPEPWALRLLPQGPGFGERRAGFLRVPTRASGLWAAPRMADPEALARILLANPHLVLVQAVEPLSDAEMENARGELDAQLGGAGAEHEEFLGTPLRAQTLIVAAGDPGTLPLRAREHLRGWFTGVELDEVAISEAGPGTVMPEMLAAGMLRFPATVDNTFPGLQVEPQTVSYSGDRIVAPGIRAGTARTVRDEPCDIVLTDEVLSRHVHVIGETGSGKSTLLTALALETAARGEGFLFLDPHGTTVDRILRELDPAARERVWLIRCGDTERPVRLNPFAVPTAASRDLVIGDMVEAFQQLFDPKYEGIVGPRFQRVMRNVLASLSEVRGDRTSLIDVARLIEDDELAKAVFESLADPALRSFWKNDFFTNRSSEGNEVRAWVASKFGGFTSNAAMRAMLGSGADSFDPVAAMAQDRIVLVDLAKGEVGITGSRVLGMLYLLRFWSAALSRPDPHPFTLFVDEAGSFSSVPLSSILAEGRKFGLRAIIAHQFMSQLAFDLAEAVEGSVATRAIFRVGHDDARTFALATHPEFGPLDLAALPQFTAAMRLADTGFALRPFTLEVDHNDRAASQPDADQAQGEISARTNADLVEPHLDARPMEVADLSSQRRPARLRDDSFLDRWLEERREAGKQRAPRPAGVDGTPRDDAVETDD